MHWGAHIALMHIPSTASLCAVPFPSRPACPGTYTHISDLSGHSSSVSSSSHIGMLVTRRPPFPT